MPSSSYGHYEEVVVQDKWDELYGGTRRLVATLVPETVTEQQPEAPLVPQLPELEPASIPEPVAVVTPNTVEVAPTPTLAPAPATAPAPVPESTPPGNGSREAWAAYAASLGLTVTDDLTRNELRALVNEHSMKEN